MNNKNLFVFLSISFVVFLLISLSACKDEILEIEADNTFSWQKYMSEEEFIKIKEGMSYIEVVRITGGAGEELEEGIYEWNDELLLTRGYRLTFQEDQLIKMDIVERRGHSTR